MKRMLTFVIALAFVGVSWGGNSALATNKTLSKNKKKKTQELVLIVKSPNAKCKAAIEANKPSYARIVRTKKTQDVRVVMPKKGADNKKYQEKLKGAGCSVSSILQEVKFPT